MVALAAQCHWHPDRRAVGRCVELQVPMCRECSTVYRGVNLSVEGLKRRQARQQEAADAAAKAGAGRTLRLGWATARLLAALVALLVVERLWWHGFTAVIQLQREAIALGAQLP